MKENETIEPGEITTPVNKEQTDKNKTGKTKTRIEILVEKYAKAYPREKVFHVTSDMQVFLSKDKNLAELHQRSLDKEENLQTIKVK